ncbi:hypothetical protein BgiMline_006447, partial [Biomphalaria glabrata]
ANAANGTKRGRYSWSDTARADRRSDSRPLSVSVAATVLKRTRGINIKAGLHVSVPAHWLAIS